MTDSFRGLILTALPGFVYNVFEAVDVIALIKGGVYDDLNLPVGEALKKRSAVCVRHAGLRITTNAFHRTFLVFIHAL